MSSKKLMIVESPAKAHTIGKLLGGDTVVRASYGHVRDLPESGGLHVDLAHGFAPDYVLTSSGRKVIAELRKLAKESGDIYLATDPDREGEAISWHLKELLRTGTKAAFHRISYHEITRSAIMSAFEHPGDIDMKLVDAQQARRVLDRIVGFLVSPLACRNVAPKTSAGRVQSVALRLVVEREREIQNFKPEEYWNLEAVFSPEGAQCALKTRLTRIGGHKAEIHDAAHANGLADALEASETSHRVLAVTDKPRKQSAAPPFITSTLQQAAGSFLHFSTSQTMKLAQELYEGVESSNGGTTGGLITYMRTDSVNIAKEAQEAARNFINANYGSQYVPEKPNSYRSGKSAQEAHEAIRPTNVERTPDSLTGILTPQQLKLYKLIWNRFVASQMAPAQQIDHAIEIESTGVAVANIVAQWQFDSDNNRSTAGKADSATGCVFRTAARETVFPGYQIVYSMKDLGQEDEMDNIVGRLPHLSANTACQLSEKPLKREQCFTQPPGRYSEASLVKAMESNGVGRPSTYAATVSAIQNKSYVEKKNSALWPTDLGMRLCDFLVAKFPELFNVGFTAQMEEQLDEIAEGALNWVSMLDAFYGNFRQWLEQCGGNAIPGGLVPEDAQKLLQLFPENFTFVKNEENPRYDDEKLINSLRKQVFESKRAISERQSGALLHVIAKYAKLSPEMIAHAEQLGIGELVRDQCEKDNDAEENASKSATVPDDVIQLLNKMKDVTWEKPVTRGRRVYDDAKFYRSIERQAKFRKQLSEAQIAALKKLATKYAVQLGGSTDSFATQDTDNEPVTETAPVTLSPLVKAEVDKLMAKCANINSWHPVTKRGRRVYDDKAFYTSLEEQYRLRGYLTIKQIDALRKLCAKYPNKHNDDSSETATETNMPMAAKSENVTDVKTANANNYKDEILDEKCPECGAPLVRKAYRGRTFIGCTAYPQCKYARKG